MNRIPNYRVWHKIEKRFVDLRSIDFEKENIGYDAYREGNYYDIASFKDIVFQQFTGLKDKNGKEIFEGDVIRGLFNMGPAGEAIHTATVYWNDLNGYQWNYWNLDIIEVIGNIFELPCNPDYNGECLVCDEPLDGCPFNKNGNNKDWAEQLLDVCKTTSVISEEQISLDLPEKYKPEFEEFMRGKTCPILDNGQRGVYSWDFEQYLKTVLRNMNIA